MKKELQEAIRLLDDFMAKKCDYLSDGEYLTLLSIMKRIKKVESEIL